jgi:hypothetical protein
MKQLVEDKIIFNPADKTLDFSRYPGFDISRLYAVINVTANAPIYVAGAPGLGVTSISGSIITLNYNTASQSSTDRLNVYYDAAPGIESNTPVEIGGNLEFQTRILTQILTELKVQSWLLHSLFWRTSLQSEEIEDLRKSVSHPANWEDTGNIN